MILHKYKLSIVGAGNVGFHLAQRLKDAGHEIKEIWSKNNNNAVHLARKTISNTVENISDLSIDVDMIIFTVKDSSLKQILEENDFGDTMMVHCSGSMPINVFEGHTASYGVLYPVQTFSKMVDVEMGEVPICVNATDQESLEKLNHLGQSISEKVYHLDDEKRVSVHVAAVFVNNFTNHLYTLASDILEGDELSFSMLAPLIKETAKKAIENRPADVQTGPAVRKDEETVQKHLEQLGSDEQLKYIYEYFTRSIQEYKTTDQQ